MWEGYWTQGNSSLPAFLELAGRWEVLHTSGYVSKDDLKRAISLIHIHFILPVHTAMSQKMSELAPVGKTMAIHYGESFLLQKAGMKKNAQQKETELRMTLRNINVLSESRAILITLYIKPLSQRRLFLRQKPYSAKSDGCWPCECFLSFPSSFRDKMRRTACRQGYGFQICGKLLCYYSGSKA